MPQKPDEIPESPPLEKQPRNASRNKKRLLAVGLGIALVVLLGVVGALLNSNVEPISDESDQTEDVADMGMESETLVGLSLSPKSFTGSDFTEFFEQAERGDIVSWAGPWTDIEGDGSPANVVFSLADQYEFSPMLITGTHAENNGINPVEPLTEAAKERFIGVLRDFAEQHRPQYIGIGNEVNRIYADSPDEYLTFVEWFNDAATAVKDVSPDTKVFVTYQYENLNGLNGGLFGGVNDPESSQWQLLDDVPLADVIAFTTYPYLIYQTPQDIPDDYYRRIAGQTDKQVAFSEVGWPRGTEAAGFGSDPQEQVAFIERFSTLSEGLAPEFIIWPFLYDQSLDPPFSTVYLQDDVNSEAYQAWLSL